MRLPASILPVMLIVLALGVPARSVRAQVPTGLQASHYCGQTFLTWNAAKGDVVGYAIYRSQKPVLTGFTLRFAQRVGQVRPGGARNLRLQSILGSPQFFRLPSNDVVLDAEDELCVLTTPRQGSFYYVVVAITSRGEVSQVSEGRNALGTPVFERPAPPRPVFQQRITWNGRAVDLFAHWVTNRDTPYMSAMSSQVSYPFNLALVKNGKAATHPLVVRLHGRGDNFLNQVWSSGNPQEYILTLDDDFPGEVHNTYWFGYPEGLDIHARSMPPPERGRIADFTLRRTLWTIDWACHALPVDTHRVFLVGISMGASGALLTAMAEPQRFAAVSALLPRVTYTPGVDPNGPLTHASRRYEQIWGLPSARLMTTSGVPVYERVRFASEVRMADRNKLPYFSFINGRHDQVVGWFQAHDAYNAIRHNAIGARAFWDPRGHVVEEGTYWRPEEHLFRLSRLRSDMSFPAVVNASSDGNYGKGLASDGDSTGQLGAFVEWLGPVIDRDDCWSMSVRTRVLDTRDGPLLPPLRITADIVPRRLQRFVVKDGGWYHCMVTAPDGSVRSEHARAFNGTIMLHSVELRSEPSRVEIRPVAGP